MIDRADRAGQPMTRRRRSGELSAMNEILKRIDGWESAGLIDADTATRLRAAEASTPDATSGTAPAAAATPHRDSGGRTMLTGLGTAFGPTASIAEMFAYLGAAFVIAAYWTFLARVADQSRDREVIFAVGSALLTVVVMLIGAWLAGRDERSRRGAGSLFLVSVVGAAVTANFLTQVMGWSWGVGPELFVAGAALAVALILRSLLPALATQVGLLGSVTFFGAMVLDVAKRVIEGRLTDAGGGYNPDYVPPRADVVMDVLLPAAGWLFLALVLGLIGLAEARRRTPAADVRAGLSRFWAGMVAIAGTWSAISTSGYVGADTYDRVLEPWMGDLILGVVVAVLVERALRRDAAAYILPAAIGLIAALTDLNFRYLANSTEIGLLLEGAILLAVGFSADRVRRRLGGGHPAAAPPRVPPAPPEPPPAEAPAVS
jgi:hypothetical protein